VSTNTYSKAAGKGAKNRKQPCLFWLQTHAILLSTAWWGVRVGTVGWRIHAPARTAWPGGAGRGRAGRGARVDALTKSSGPPRLVSSVFVPLAHVPGPTRGRRRNRSCSASRSMSPPWRPIRFRVALRTYRYAPWGCIVRVVSQTKSRKIPTRKMLPHFFRNQSGNQARRGATTAPAGPSPSPTTS